MKDRFYGVGEPLIQRKRDHGIDPEEGCRPRARAYAIQEMTGSAADFEEIAGRLTADNTFHTVTGIQKESDAELAATV